MLMALTVQLCSSNRKIVSESITDLKEQRQVETAQLVYLTLQVVKEHTVSSVLLQTTCSQLKAHVPPIPHNTRVDIIVDKHETLTMNVTPQANIN